MLGSPPAVPAGTAPHATASCTPCATGVTWKCTRACHTSSALTTVEARAAQSAVCMPWRVQPIATCTTSVCSASSCAITAGAISQSSPTWPGCASRDEPGRGALSVRGKSACAARPSARSPYEQKSALVMCALMRVARGSMKVRGRLWRITTLIGSRAADVAWTWESAAAQIASAWTSSSMWRMAMMLVGIADLGRRARVCLHSTLARNSPQTRRMSRCHHRAGPVQAMDEVATLTLAGQYHPTRLSWPED